MTEWMVVEAVREVLLKSLNTHAQKLDATLHPPVGGHFHRLPGPDDGGRTSARAAGSPVRSQVGGALLPRNRAQRGENQFQIRITDERQVLFNLQVLRWRQPLLLAQRGVGSHLGWALTRLITGRVGPLGRPTSCGPPDPSKHGVRDIGTTLWRRTPQASGEQERDGAGVHWTGAIGHAGGPHRRQGVGDICPGRGRQGGHGRHDRLNEIGGCRSNRRVQITGATSRAVVIYKGGKIGVNLVEI